MGLPSMLSFGMICTSCVAKTAELQTKRDILRGAQRCLNIFWGKKRNGNGGSHIAGKSQYMKFGEGRRGQFGRAKDNIPPLQKPRTKKQKPKIKSQKNKNQIKRTVWSRER